MIDQLIHVLCKCYRRDCLINIINKSIRQFIIAFILIICRCRSGLILILYLDMFMVDVESHSLESLHPRDGGANGECTNVVFGLYTPRRKIVWDGRFEAHQKPCEFHPLGLYKNAQGCQGGTRRITDLQV